VEDEAFLEENWAYAASLVEQIPGVALDSLALAHVLPSLVELILSLVYPSLCLYLLALSARRRSASL